MSADRRVKVDRDGIRFLDDDTAVCDILVENHRVMSLVPGGTDRLVLGGGRHKWPRRLRPYLVGTAHIRVVEHESGAVHFDDEVQFDSSPRRPQIVDHNGRPLIVNKWGGLATAFHDSDDVSEQVEMTAALLDDLNEIGVPAFVAYGTLLGAVRSGTVIAHDTDADVSYLSPFSHPADIARESFNIQRELRDRGWKIGRGRLAKLTVTQLHKVDIFVSYFVGDTFYLDQWAEGPLRRDQILPLSAVTLEGRALPAPADPAALLALNYGPEWRTPDPSFAYDPNAPELERVKGWFGGHTSHQIRWNHYWTETPADPTPTPSPFAVWAGPQIDPDTLVLDIGCGPGADLRYLAGQGLSCLGYDFAGKALALARQSTDTLRPRPRFKQLFLSDTRQVLAEGARLATNPRPKTVLARLTLETLPADGYTNFWHFLRLATARGGAAMLELRADSSVPLPEAPPWLWRRELDLGEVTARLQSAGATIASSKAMPAGRGGTALHRITATFEPSGSHPPA